MDIRVSSQGNVTVIEIDGEINISTSPRLKKELEKLPSARVVVNLSKVGYVDSSGLATLVELLKRTKVQGGSLHLSHLSDKVRSLFEITKLDRLFGIYPDIQTAISNFKP